MTKDVGLMFRVKNPGYGSVNYSAQFELGWTDLFIKLSLKL